MFGHGKQQSDPHEAVSAVTGEAADVRIFTSHSIPEIQSLNPGYDFDGSHDGVDDGEDAAHEAKNDRDRDTEYRKEPETERHQIRISEQFLFHCLFVLHEQQEQGVKFIRINLFDLFG